MKLIVAGLALALLAAAPAWAQTAAPESRGTERPRRAPLAVPDNLAPAVDVSRPAPPTAPAASAAPPRAAAPAVAPPDAAATAAAVPAPRERAPVTAANTIDLGTTSITGNQELPKVLYIVPWKRSDLAELVGRPVNTLLDEVLAPVDPEVFERHLQYYESLFGAREEE